MCPAAPKDNHLEDYYAWRDCIVRKNAFECRPINFDDSREWFFRDGILRHRTGGFFSLAGISADSRFELLDGREQLIILQPETAINGFLIRRQFDRTEVLMQGRVEPGNVDALELAPTDQSTEANYKRLHGGADPIGTTNNVSNLTDRATGGGEAHPIVEPTRISNFIIFAGV